ncbi:MAG: endopeptidase La [Gammaproteobacteria bacterium]|nr:endopeptidase La [Gammaproteobacteria bacterium]MDH5215629.1 endopeptidase La [Gammaproteobacteria bacterium]
MSNQASQDLESSVSSTLSIPDDALAIIPVRNVVLFPGIIVPISISRKLSVAAAQAVGSGTDKVGLLLQKDSSVDDPGAQDLHTVGTIAAILRYVTDEDGTLHLICNGESRFRVTEFLSGFPFLVAHFELPEEPVTSEDALKAHALVLKQQASRAVELLPFVPAELKGALQSIEQPAVLCDLVASFLDIPVSEKQQILETLDVQSRLENVVARMAKHLEIIELSHEIETKTRESLSERQREAILREQLRTIQQQLGEDGSTRAEFEAIEKAISDAEMPDNVSAHARKELDRLKHIPSQSSEYSLLRTYLDWLTELPWSVVDAESIDITRAREILDEDHFGLVKVKKRIIEYLAVRKLKPDGRSPILCFSGPPGVGKTSLGRSIARAIGLRFVRISLGGLHDEAEIRGHRRTYVGALPGKIIQAVRKAGSRNPVFMMDEMDKLGAGFHGDPSSALLEVLDPEQNSTFEDNYIAVPFDLSKVLFIGTANRLDTIPAPLLDRMEIIELSGYTLEEKVQIAKRYLVRRQCEANGIDESQIEITDAALESIIASYTREAGCRALEKQIGAVLRNVAVGFAEKAEMAEARVCIGPDDVGRVLGAPVYEDEVALRIGVPGVATGLAWTPVGGDILFVESTLIPGEGRLILTGQLGDVMKESAQAALSLLKSRADALKLDKSAFADKDIHLHVPAGAIPKDGPSAGVAMFVSLASMLSNRAVRHDAAMSGEISLRGLVLPVGGIKEKVIAAHRAGIGTVLLPSRNRKDFDDIPQSTREGLRFVWLNTVDDALREVLEFELLPASARRASG